MKFNLRKTFLTCVTALQTGGCAATYPDVYVPMSYTGLQSPEFASTKKPSQMFFSLMEPQDDEEGKLHVVSLSDEQKETVRDVLKAYSGAIKVDFREVPFNDMKN